MEESSFSKASFVRDIISNTALSISSIRVFLISSGSIGSPSGKFPAKRAILSAKSPRRSRLVLILYMANTKRRSMATGAYRAIISSQSLSILSSKAFTLRSLFITLKASSLSPVSNASPALYNCWCTNAHIWLMLAFNPFISSSITFMMRLFMG